MNKIERFGEYTFEYRPLGLKKGIEVVNLTLRQLETLRLLVSKRGEPVAKAIFFEQVWHGDYVEDGNLTQTIFLLRKALGKLPDGGEYIETLPRIGYRLAPAAFALAIKELTDTKVEEPVGFVRCVEEKHGEGGVINGPETAPSIHAEQQGPVDFEHFVFVFRIDDEVGEIERAPHLVLAGIQTRPGLAAVG